MDEEVVALEGRRTQDAGIPSTSPPEFGDPEGGPLVVDGALGGEPSPVSGVPVERPNFFILFNEEEQLALTVALALSLASKGGEDELLDRMLDQAVRAMFLQRVVDAADAA